MRELGQFVPSPVVEAERLRHDLAYQAALLRAEQERDHRAAVELLDAALAGDVDKQHQVRALAPVVSPQAGDDAILEALLEDLAGAEAPALNLADIGVLGPYLSNDPQFRVCWRRAQDQANMRVYEMNKLTRKGA